MLSSSSVFLLTAGVLSGVLILILLGATFASSALFLFVAGVLSGARTLSLRERSVAVHLQAALVRFRSHLNQS